MAVSWHHTAPTTTPHSRSTLGASRTGSWHGVYPSPISTTHPLSRHWTSWAPRRRGANAVLEERMMPTLERVASVHAPATAHGPRVASRASLKSGRDSRASHGARVAVGVTPLAPTPSYSGQLSLARPSAIQLLQSGAWQQGGGSVDHGGAVHPRRHGSATSWTSSSASSHGSGGSGAHGHGRGRRDSSGSSSDSSDTDSSEGVVQMHGRSSDRLVGRDHVLATRGRQPLPPISAARRHRLASRQSARGTRRAARNPRLPGAVGAPRGAASEGADEPVAGPLPRARRHVKSTGPGDALGTLNDCSTGKTYASWRVRYGPLSTAVFSLVLALWIADRFVTNWWPRQMFSIGAGSAGSDQIDGYKDGPWSVLFYDVVARLSGRASIALLAALQFTTMNTLHAWLPTTLLSRVIDFADAPAANLRYHRRMGISLCVLTLVHVWSILGPCVVNDYDVRVVPGTFEWPLSERKPAGFKDVNAKANMVMLQIDDVWRLVLMTLILLVLMPLSVVALQRRYRVGIRLHTFIHLMYFADIARRHTHPHSWVINTPFFVLWVADKVWGRCRRHVRLSTARPQQQVRSVLLDNDYMLLAWHSPWGPDADTPAPRVHARVPGFTVEPRHAFSGYQNLCGADLPAPPLELANPAWTGQVMKAAGDVLVYNRAWQAALPALGSSADTGHWTLGLVVRTYTAPHSHTRVMRRLAEGGANPELPPPVTLDVWGPTPSTLSAALRVAMHSGGRRRRAPSPAVVAAVAGGSAAAYLLDTLQLWHPARSPPLLVVYSSRSITLFQWFVWAVHAVARARGWGAGTRVPGLRVVVALTSKAVRGVDGVPASGWFQVVAGRADLATCLAPFLKGGEASPRRCPTPLPLAPQRSAGAPQVFFEGGGALQAYVTRVARGVGAHLHAGAPFDESAGGGGSGVPPGISAPAAADALPTKRVRVGVV